MDFMSLLARSVMSALMISIMGETDRRVLNF